MLTPQKLTLLRSLLAALPPQAAARLLEAVETDRSAGGNILPHELMANALQAAHNTRVSMLQCLFYRPFEDLLVEEQPNLKQKGRISRDNAFVIWGWFSNTVLREASKAGTADITRFVLENRDEKGNVCAAEFWTFAAAAIADAIGRGRNDVCPAFRSEAVAADAEEIALLLSVGTAVVEIQSLLPRYTPQLDDALLRNLRAAHDRIADVVPDAAPYVAVIAMRRLSRPWEALKIPQVITNQTQDTLISNTDMGLVGDLLLADIESHGTAVRAARHPAFDPDALIGHLARFTELSSHIVREIEVRRGGKWGKRLLADRAGVAEAMEDLLKHASNDIVAMLPVQLSGGYSGRAKRADLSGPVDGEKAERGFRYAKLLVGSGPYASMGSFASAWRDTVDAISQHIRSYIEDLIKQMRALENEKRLGVVRQFEVAVELTALLVSPEEAEFLRRRGKVALASQAA